MTVSHGGRVLEIRGGFLYGVADEARKALKANPKVRRVRLNSGGGSLTEAQQVRALILERNLDTDSTTGCSSACVSAYIGGHHRLLRSSARLGFHLPRNPGYGIRGRLTADYAAEINYFARRGVPRWFWSAGSPRDARSGTRTRSSYRLPRWCTGFTGARDRKT